MLKSRLVSSAVRQEEFIQDSVSLLVFQPRAILIGSSGAGTLRTRARQCCRALAPAGTGSGLALPLLPPLWSCLRVNIQGGSSVKGGPCLRPSLVQSALLHFGVFTKKRRHLTYAFEIKRKTKK